FAIFDDNRAERRLPGGNALLRFADRQTHVFCIDHQMIPFPPLPVAGPHLSPTPARARAGASGSNGWGRGCEQSLGRVQTATLASGGGAGRTAYSLGRRRTSSLVAGRFSLGTCPLETNDSACFTAVQTEIPNSRGGSPTALLLYTLTRFSRLSKNSRLKI